LTLAIKEVRCCSVNIHLIGLQVDSLQASALVSKLISGIEGNQGELPRTYIARVDASAEDIINMKNLLVQSKNDPKGLLFSERLSSRKDLLEKKGEELQEAMGLMKQAFRSQKIHVEDD
jgi:hypothetical protein